MVCESREQNVSEPVSRGSSARERTPIQCARLAVEAPPVQILPTQKHRRSDRSRKSKRLSNVVKFPTSPRSVAEGPDDAVSAEALPKLMFAPSPRRSRSAKRTTAKEHVAMGLCQQAGVQTKKVPPASEVKLALVAKVEATLAATPAQSVDSAQTLLGAEAMESSEVESLASVSTVEDIVQAKHMELAPADIALVDPPKLATDDAVMPADVVGLAVTAPVAPVANLKAATGLVTHPTALPSTAPKPRSRKPSLSAPPSSQSSCNASVLLRLRITNLKDARDTFFASNCSEAPRFTYKAGRDEHTAQVVGRNSNVCFKWLPQAERILKRAQDAYGGPQAVQLEQNCRCHDGIADDRQSAAVETDRCCVADLQNVVLAYLENHGLKDLVAVRMDDALLSAASVTRPSPRGKYVLNMCAALISRGMVQGVCDHEIGTHLLRMISDERQAWRMKRAKYDLAGHCAVETTEEGLAALNTYRTSPCKLLHDHALRYRAVCLGARLGFVELYRELLVDAGSPENCWRTCCRVKRGLLDTSLPGAFWRDQTYFRGAVELLRHMGRFDFRETILTQFLTSLYCGRVALEDVDKIWKLANINAVIMPHFLRTRRAILAWTEHCREIVRENCLGDVCPMIGTMARASSLHNLVGGSSRHATARDASTSPRQLQRSASQRAHSRPRIATKGSEKDDCDESLAKLDSRLSDAVLRGAALATRALASCRTRCRRGNDIKSTDVTLESARASPARRSRHASKEHRRLVATE
eukprot:TRINITY_DN17039_c0_g1_i1.p1 TRINITY_DN17039_c0_g1~~TRINITY_DN17039_c0_g1_i1.p1  ORF type:complete len:756 (-),score=120.91 TRINITY_DN17039_c0_g1_i1:550-2817(-)